LTHRGVEQVLELMGLGTGDRFVDLGSGVGHVTLQAAEAIPTLGWSRGVEVVEASWSVAWQRARELEAADAAVAPIYFHLGDLMEYGVDDLPDATH
jgi:ubiquinone/menaquinone biosynthesis C-methylase UbiE